VILFTGFAPITHGAFLLLIPLGMAFNFVVVILSPDTHLEKKYKKGFREYAKETKKVAPFVY